jgi:predicted deacylase
MIFQGKEIITHPDFQSFRKGEIHSFWVDIVANGVGQDILVPVMVARGLEDGPTLGVTAAVHGNELNGLSIVQKLFSELNLSNLKGTLIGLPVVNIPSVLNQERRFSDGEDLNRVFPGRKEGDASEVYSYRIFQRVVSKFDYHIDLHTASFGRVNSFYIRANLSNPITKRMAELQQADIILDTSGEDGTLRTAAAELGIHSITVEVGDPNKFQKGMIRSGLEGIYKVMIDFGVMDGEHEEQAHQSIVCSRSKWIFSDKGGIMVVHPQVTDMIEVGDKIATVKNVFGEVVKEFYATEPGVVIGKHVHPINQTGARIIHLGTLHPSLKLLRDAWDELPEE